MRGLWRSLLTPGARLRAPLVPRRRRPIPTLLKGKNLIDLVEEGVVTEKTLEAYLGRHVQSSKSQGALTRRKGSRGDCGWQQMNRAGSSVSGFRLGCVATSVPHPPGLSDVHRPSLIAHASPRSDRDTCAAVGQEEADRLPSGETGTETPRPNTGHLTAGTQLVPNRATGEAPPLTALLLSFLRPA